MTSPPETIPVARADCGLVCGDRYRPSVDLTLDDFDDECPDQCRSAACPQYGSEGQLDVLVVDHNGTFAMRSC